MKVAISLDLPQKVFSIRLVSGDLSGESTLDLEFYESQTGDALYTYTLTATQLTYLQDLGVVLLLTDDVFTTYPSDSYLYCRIVGDVTTSDWTSCSFTLDIRSEVYSRLSQLNVYSPDYYLSTLLYTCKMLLDEMEQIQYLDFETQKKVDFDVRLSQLQEIMSI